MLDLTTEATIEAAQIYATLKQSGKLIGEFDLLIAAIAKVNDEEILTRDHHFEAIPSSNYANGYSDYAPCKPVFC
jgi:predicted nucleic acid-binding protein